MQHVINIQGCLSTKKCAKVVKIAVGSFVLETVRATKSLVSGSLCYELIERSPSAVHFLRAIMTTATRRETGFAPPLKLGHKTKKK